MADKEVKLPQNPMLNYSDESQINKAIYFSFDRCQKDMLQFFVDFLDEHIKMNKERKWDTIQLVALKINFQSRFMKDKKNE